METVSTGVLLVLAMVVFVNLRDGQLGTWLRAKFLNDAAPKGATNGASLVDLLKGQLPGLPTSSKTPGSSTPPSSAGSWTAPVAGAGVSQPFGGQHQGVDLTFPGALGAPVVAAAAGTVTFAGAAGDYGLRVDVDHGAGTVTRYAHLQKITVNTGEQVNAGEQIGTVGTTGNATGPHLHFELRRNGTPSDPCAVVACGGRVA